MILLFTDELSICLNRANQRFLNGGHLVEPEVVREMYQNQLPLLEEYFEHYDNVSMYDVRDNAPLARIPEYEGTLGLVLFSDDGLDWFSKGIEPFVNRYIWETVGQGDE